jgi:alkylation response protein AidB-like acyl-CoA dehydrogenase
MWPAAGRVLSHPAEYGGQGMPMSLGLIKSEMMGTANWSFTMYPGLSLGAMNTIMQHATEEQKNLFMPPLVEGRWTGTMCLTEPQCGTDLGPDENQSRTECRWQLPHHRHQDFHLGR